MGITAGDLGGSSKNINRELRDKQALRRVVQVNLTNREEQAKLLKKAGLT